MSESRQDYFENHSEEEMTSSLKDAVEDAQSVVEHLQIFGGENLRIKNTELFITTLQTLITHATRQAEMVEVLKGAVKTLNAAKYAINGREHTGFIDDQITIINKIINGDL